MSTIHSVPDVQSTGPADGALSASPLSQLVEAAEKLARLHIVSGRVFSADDRTPAEHCTFCLHGSRGGVLNHAAGCAVGQVQRAIVELRASAAERGVADPSRLLAFVIEGADLLNLYLSGDCPTDVARVYLEKVRVDWPGRLEPIAAQVSSRDADRCDQPGCVLRAGHELPCSPEWFPIDSPARPHVCDSSGRRCIVPNCQCAAKPIPYSVTEDDLASPVESDESYEASAAILAAQASERRVVCGHGWPLPEKSGLALLTCDKEVGHDADPKSDHWNREASLSWPTAALIAEETAATR